MAHTDDQWVRLFNVSDPRRAYAGHTLYKVTSKVFQREFPEGATEIAVWRRFTDFKKLHQELLKIYLFKDLKEEQFPPFPKAKFFGRFEEGVIEERRKAALELLNFAGNIPDLFTSQPFVKFFEGGFPDSPIRSESVASRESSLSDAESESPPPTAVSVQDETHDSSIRIERQSPSPSCTSGKENGDNLDEASLGGVWLYKQPSLTEGLDNLSSDEESNECQEPSESALSTAENESTPNNLTGEPNEEFMVKTEEDQDEVFMDEAVECSESDSLITEREKRDSNTQPPNWLVRAISICSEGEDLEALASEADSEELSFPQAFSDYSSCSGEERTKESESLEKVHENQFHDNSRSYLSADSYHTLNVHDNDDTENLPTECSLSCDRGQDDHHGIETGLDKASHMINPPAKPESSNSSSGTGAYSDKDSHSLKDNASVGTADKQSFTSSSDSGRAAIQRRPIYDLGNIFIDCKESDYLYMAGHTIHKALDCEVSGRYEEAFSLYKTCVSLLLSGVQEEKDVKRREAVRRKTAQYLLKAEALYNAYLTNNESQDEKPEQESSSSHPSNSICDTDDQHKFKDLTLADLKVMGIVGKVMLVENSHNGDTYVLKALCKSGSVRPPGHSHGNERRRKKSVRRLYGKYPNIVQLFRYFETGSSIYLLLEYARGGRLWDHIACYRSNQESQATGNAREQNRLGLKKTTHDQCDKNEKNDAVNVTRTSYQEAGKDLAVDRVPENITNSNAKSSCSGQASEDSTKTSNASLVQPELSIKTNGATSPYNGNNNELSVTKEGSKGDKDLVKTCSEKAEADASRDNKHLLFLKLDEYFASSSQRLPDENVKIWAAEIVLAVAYLHTSGIICRDLHPKNVLLDEEGHVLLTYFGSWEETEHVPDEEAVNHFYCAPEVWQIEEITVAADWWSVGALLYELITGQALSTAHPWGIQTHTELQLPIKISPEAKSLLRELLRVAPSERLGSGVNGVEEIKSHPFFNGVNWTWLCSRIS